MIYVSTLWKLLIQETSSKVERLALMV